jgi:hypothetical protein
VRADAGGVTSRQGAGAPEDVVAVGVRGVAVGVAGEPVGGVVVIGGGLEAGEGASRGLV